MTIPNTTLKSNKKHLTLDELHLNNEVRSKINQLLEEFTYLEALRKLNIPVDNKILLYGHTGCGKTATAHAIGLALNKNVITINLGGFVSSRLGETAKNLSDIFKQAARDQAILFLDEFDFIGKLRDYDEKDSGEMKRLVNTLIQQIDQLPDQTLLICATNHIGIIDSALLRRFQLKLTYQLPSPSGLDDYYNSILAAFPADIAQINRQYGISYAEAKDITFQQIKTRVIQKEKEKTHVLFVYDSFNSAYFQKKINGQKPIGDAEVIEKYKLNVEPHLNSHLGPDQKIALRSTDNNDTLKGKLYKIKGAQLMQIDRDVLSQYKRVNETTTSGNEVWLYVSKNSF